MTAMPLLQADHLTRAFGGLVAVSDVTLEVRDREILGLIGPNGAGKTTMFNMLAGSMPPTSGRIRFDGADVTARVARILRRARPMRRTRSTSSINGSGRKPPSAL